ncbi:MAG TPA: tetratricopeptide repeat protein [Caulobacteraceae bacterium]|jgi:uncharacterized protein (TIGR02466 family)|nr:tetratricopeptide repeat protein [Caulobacteraceae bacterium]
MGLRANLQRHDAAACYQAGEDRHRLGDIAGALIDYDAALALEPDHGPALRLSALALYQQGEAEAALARLRPAIELFAGQAEVWGAHGVILAALDRTAEAAEAFQRGLDLAPEDGVLWFNLGLAHQRLGRLDAVIPALAQAARLLDTHPAHHALGVAYQTAGQFDQAALSYGMALERGAGAESALNAGAARHQLGDDEAAEGFYRQALEQDPLCVQALNNLAALAQDAGDHPRAAALCRRAIAIDPAFADARNNLGVTLQRLGDADGALAAYQAALAIEPGGAAALGNLTELLFDQDRGTEAVGHHRAAAGARPADPETWLALATALERGGDLAGAAEALERATGLDDQYWRGHHRLGELLQRTGDLAAALPRHRRACALAPDQADAWRQLALAAIKAGDGETAMAGVARLTAIDPFDPQAWSARALALRLLGREDEADDLTDREELVAVLPLPAPPGYPSLAVFHQSLAADLAAVGLRAWSPRGQSVVGGFQTQNDLFAEPAAAIQALRRLLDQAVAAFLDAPDPTIRRFVPTSLPARRYRGWSVNLKAGGRHAPHIHPEGRLSGVYYVQTPGEDSNDLGGLEFGRPGFAVPLPVQPPTRVIQPRPGNLVLFPSYLWHGTLPFESPGERITVAFDLLR